MSSPLWEKCLSHLEGDLSAQQLNTWLRPLQAIETEESLRLLAPNPYVKAWVQEQLEAQINQLVHQLTQGLIEYVSIEVGTIDHVPQRPKRVATTSAPAKTNKEEKSETIKSEPALGSPINPLFTFDSYVEGKSNQIARAASLHVA